MTHKNKSFDERAFANELEDYVDGKSENVFMDGTRPRLTPSFKNKLEKAIKHLCHELDNRLDNAFSFGEKIYSGSAGIALLAILNDKRNQLESKAFKKASRVILESAKTCRIDDRISFLNGNAGVLALAALLYNNEGNRKEVDNCIEKLIQFSKYCFSSGKYSPPDELLYGRAGYLYSLLMIQKNIPDHHIPTSHIKEVIDKIIDSGKRLAARSNSKIPLQYTWHDKEYIGAAHGYCGILHTLLLAYQEGLISDSSVQKYIKPTLDQILELKYPSRNLPSSINSGKDRLVQWCHGAPGAIHMVALAYEIFKDKKYLKTAIDFGEVTWDRGLLKKGYSLCHGVSGNGYTFLRLYQLTGEIIHLHRATKFAEWCFKYGKRQTCDPDRPCSLYEGLSGVIYFLMDLQEPEKAKFPGVEL